MAVPTVGNMQVYHSSNASRSLWDMLTEPASMLKADNKPKARLLAAVLVVFFPLATIAVFLTPLIALLGNKPVTPPTLGLLTALVFISSL